LKRKININILVIILTVINSCGRNFSPFEPNFPYNNALVYNKVDKHGKWQIFLNAIAGDRPQNISNNPNEDAYNPIWSPTGEYIAFRWDKSIGGSDIYLYDLTGDSLINITKDLEMNESVSPVMWTPDGEKLIYIHHKFGEERIYKIMNKDGSEKQFLLKYEVGDSINRIIQFNPDNYHLIYTNEGNVYKTDIKQTVTELIITKDMLGENNYYIYGFDPYQERILFAETTLRWCGKYDYILIYNIKTTEIDTVAKAIHEQLSYLHVPAFSNDFSKVAFSRTFNNYSSAALCIWQNGQETTLSDNFEDYNHPLFSPDNNYIAYERRVNTTNGEWYTFTTYLYVVNINTKKNYMIDQAQRATWNPLFKY